MENGSSHNNVSVSFRDETTRLVCALDTEMMIIA